LIVIHQKRYHEGTGENINIILSYSESGIIFSYGINQHLELLRFFGIEEAIQQR
jgi:hypothetical protein